MRSLATLATLLLGLAVVFWAPAAKADCPHNDDDTHQHCGGGSSPSPSSGGAKSGHFEFHDFTFATTVGDVGGLAGMHQFCQTAFPDLGTDVRMCTAEEYALSPEQTPPLTPAWIHPSQDYLARTVSDGVYRWTCGSWSGVGLITTEGTVVQTDGTIRTTVVEEPGNALCNVARPVTCCARLN